MWKKILEKSFWAVIYRLCGQVLSHVSYQNCGEVIFRESMATVCRQVDEDLKILCTATII